MNDVKNLLVNRMISLEKACLKLVVQEFERFYFAYEMSQNKTLQFNLKFLQRVYTHELWSKLFEENRLKDEYHNFLLNEHLEFFDNNWLKSSRYSLKDVFPRLPNIINASLCYSCNDECLKSITEHCSKIERIDAKASLISDKGLKYLCKKENGKVPCPNLKTISVLDSFVTDEGVVYLIQNLPSLERIYYRNVPKLLYNLHKEDLPDLQNVHTYNIIYLTFIGDEKLPYYNDILKICLRVCPKLEAVGLSVRNDEQFHLFNGFSLKSIHLEFSKSNLKSRVNDLLKIIGSNLTVLSIANPAINFSSDSIAGNTVISPTEMSLNSIAKCCPKLKFLNMGSITLMNDPDYPQELFHCLIKSKFKDIVFESANTKAFCLLMSISPNLEYLTFHACHLASEVKSNFLNSFEKTFLKYITFNCMDIDIRFLKDILLRCPYLKTLRMEGISYPLQEITELTEYAKKLANKPDIYFCSKYHHEHDIFCIS